MEDIDFSGVWSIETGEPLSFQVEEEMCIRDSGKARERSEGWKLTKKDSSPGRVFFYGKEVGNSCKK